MAGFRELIAVSVMLFTGACGGGDSIGDAIGGDGDEQGLGEAVFGDVGEAAEGGSGTLEVLDTPTVTAAPATVTVDVDGQMLEFPLTVATHPMCDVSHESIRINLQQTESGDFSLVASPNGDSWFGSITVGLVGTNISYGADFQSGRLGIGDNAISYDGPMTKVVDFDIQNAETVEGTIAVNCDSPGGDPTAIVGDQAYAFPMSGAQGIECTIAADAFEIRINRLSVDDLQLEMQGRHDGSQWVGAIVVYTSTGNSTALLPLDGTGLVIDAGTVTFDGTFANPDGSEVAGSATATCF